MYTIEAAVVYARQYFIDNVDDGQGGYYGYDSATVFGNKQRALWAPPR